MRVLITMPVYRRTFVDALGGVFGQVVSGDWTIDTFFPWHGYGDGTRDSRLVIADKYNAARRLVLERDYDALWCVESDMRIPPDALTRLAATGADVAYGLYVFRRPPFAWSAYSVLDGMVGYPLSAVPERARHDWGSVVEVDGVGLGCTLIRRSVLERIAFRHDGPAHPDGQTSHCDWYFALDACAAGFRSVCDTAVVCGHISGRSRQGDPFGSVIWPDPNGQGLVRFDAY